MNSKVFKILTIVLILISIAVTIWGYASGFSDASLESLLHWTYTMVGLGIAAVVLVGIAISAINNPKSLFKLALVVVGAAVLVAIAYVLAPGSQPAGYFGKPLSVEELKFIDTILIITAITCAAAAVSFVIGPIVKMIRK